MPLGVGQADAWLGGGLKTDGLHEAYTGLAEDGAAMIAFLLMLGWMKRKMDSRPILWARETRGADAAGLPYGPGLAELGIDPDAVTLLLLPDARAVLRAALDGVRAGAVSTLLIELTGRQPLLDLTASRRFALAAAETGTLVLIGRRGAEPAPSAAHTRWRVAAASSRMLEAHAPGMPAFCLSLLRQRGGRDGFDIIMEWDRDTVSFRERVAGVAAAPLSRALPAVAGGGAGDPRASRAA